MARGQYSLFIDFDADGDFGDTGEDVTARLMPDLEWSRGRDLASQLKGRSQAGRLTAVLNNESEDYSPFNAASPLYGNLLPGRKVQLKGNTGEFPYTFPVLFDEPLWMGYLLSIAPEPSLHDLKVARLEAIGPLGYVNQFDASLPMATSILTGAALDDILDDAGWGAGDRDIDTGQTTMERAWVDKQLTLNALRKIEETEAGFLRETKDGKIAFEDRHHRLKDPHYTSQATFSDAAGAALAYFGVAEEDSLPFIFNELKAKVQHYTVGGLAVLWTCPEVGASSPYLDIGQVRTFWANYPNPDSAVDAFGVNAWTTPVATTDYTANTQSDGGGTDKTTDIGVAVTKLGNSMKITLTNNASTPVYITLLQARGTPITADDPIWVSAEDSASQTKYGKRSFPAPGEFIPDSGEAQDWADFHLAIHKSPIPMLALSFLANRDDAHLTQALLRDISERITVVGTGEAGLGVNGDFFIEAEQHRVGIGGRHEVTWELSDAERYSDWWVLGVSTLGESTRLAY